MKLIYMETTLNYLATLMKPAKVQAMIKDFDYKKVNGVGYLIKEL